MLEPTVRRFPHARLEQALGPEGYQCWAVFAGNTAARLLRSTEGPRRSRSASSPMCRSTSKKDGGGLRHISGTY